MAEAVPEPTPVIRELRAKVLALAPSEIGASASPATPRVWGVLMETGYPEARALGEGRHALSKLFYAGHDVITALRGIAEKPVD